MVSETLELKKIKLIEPVVGEQEVELIHKVLESGWLTEGEMTKTFEDKLKDFVGAKYAIATTSCTSALELALRSLKVGHGDEVIVPDFTHPATVNAVKWVGATPVLVDVDQSSKHLNLEETEKTITAKTTVILPVSWGGNPLNMKPFNELKEKYNLYIVEDAACSLGAEYNGQKTGVMADVTCFSFHPRKIITTGEGGMITTDSEEVAQEIKYLKNFGMNGNNFVKVGMNYKFNDILAAVGCAQMLKVKEIIHKRIELARNYTRLIGENNVLVPPSKLVEAKHVYQTYAVYVKARNVRDKLIERLREKQIETQIGTYALHLQPAFKTTRKVSNLTTSERLFKNLLALPMCHSMTEKDQEFVISNIEKGLAG